MSTSSEIMNISGFGDVALIGSQAVRYQNAYAGAHAFRLDLLRQDAYNQALTAVAQHPEHLDSSLTARILAVRTTIGATNPGQLKSELHRHQSELLNYLASCAVTYTDQNELDPVSRLNIGVDYRDIPRRHSGRHAYRR